MSGFSTKNVKEIDVIAPNPRKENCELINVEFDKENGYLDFTFRDDTGAELRDRTFEPTRQKWHETDEAFEKSVTLVLSRIKHIMGRFIPKEKTDIEAETWEDFGKIVIKNLGTSYKGVKCALKVILVENKGKWYSALPKVPNFISTEKYPKDFTIDKQYDKFEKPGSNAAPDSEGGSEQPKADF